MFFTINNDWQALLSPQFKEEYFINLQTFLQTQYQNKTIYPAQEDVFNALNYTSFSNTKVVILGQDPYHEKNQAHGLSFSVMPNAKIPPSLLNIYKELHTDLNCFIPNNGYLTQWAKQGVLLLNTILTVEEGKALSHANIGWQTFTSTIIKLLNQSPNPIVFILWGKEAQKCEKLITNQKHLIIKTAHPSPLSAYRGFFGSKVFSKTNQFLLQNHLTPINWQISNQ